MPCLGSIGMCLNIRIPAGPGQVIETIVFGAPWHGVSGLPDR